MKIGFRLTLIVIFLTVFCASVQAGTSLFYIRHLDFLRTFENFDACGIPEDYYEMGRVIPKNASVMEWLTMWQWADPWEEHSFDCSQMAAYVEWALENSGIQTDIIIGVLVDRDTGKEYGHAWVKIYMDDEVIYYETTSRHIISEKDYRVYYREMFVFDDIYKLWRYLNAYGLKNYFLREFGWWRQ